MEGMCYNKVAFDKICIRLIRRKNNGKMGVHVQRRKR